MPYNAELIAGRCFNTAAGGVIMHKFQPFREPFIPKEAIQLASNTFTNGFRPRRTVVALGAVAVFLMGVLFGGLASLAFLPQQQVGMLQAGDPSASPPSENNEDKDTEVVGVDRAICVLETTQVEWITAFAACGHECVTSDNESAVGMTLDELENTYTDYEVRLFTTEKVKLKRELQGYCPEHYVLMLERSKVCVKRTDPETLLPYTVMELSVSADMLDEATCAELEAGIPFDSLEQINAYFESLDS